MISYAQNREDVLLNRVFREVKQGFYVDVGAHDPVTCSVTKHFYDKGWRGINLEPGTIYERLAAARPRDINLPVAATDGDGPVTFHECVNDPGLSTLESNLLETARPFAREVVARTVPALTLRSVLQRHLPAGMVIDFLSVDVEGHELAVLSGNDWEQFRPRVLVIEATLPYSNTLCHEKWEHVLTSARYQFAAFDGLNRYYVRDEDAELLPRFAWPVNVLDDYVPAEQHWMQLQLDEYDRHLHRVDDFARHSEALRVQLQAEAERLQKELRRAEARARQAAADRERLGADLQRREHECARLQDHLRRLGADQVPAAGAADPPGVARPPRPDPGGGPGRWWWRRAAVAPGDPAGTSGEHGHGLLKPVKALLKGVLRPVYRGPIRAVLRPVTSRLRHYFNAALAAQVERLAAAQVEQVERLAAAQAAQQAVLLAELRSCQAACQQADQILLGLLKTFPLHSLGPLALGSPPRPFAGEAGQGPPSLAA
jgi:FkbM family methyltransferase